MTGLSLLVLSLSPAAEEPPVGFRAGSGTLTLTVAGQDVATYSYRDEKIPRPYFAHVRAPGGVQVTRNHPPKTGQDATDHAELHPGLWMAFGDLSGADSWRNRAPVRHDGFASEPRGGPGRGSFAVRNSYLAKDGQAVVCRETARHTLLARPAGYLLLWESEFRSDGGDFAFGDQEEMGLGMRVATPLTVKAGGRILTSRGHRDEKQVRGQQAEWCDYSGTIDGGRAGLTILTDPKNFRPCWYHARDYGFVAANPFGRKALTGGEASRVVVRQGETFRLRFGVLVHAAKAGATTVLDAAYRDFLGQLARAAE